MSQAVESKEIDLPVRTGYVLTANNFVVNVDDELPYEEFFHNILRANQPCIVKVGATKFWNSNHLWVKDSKPDFAFLSNTYGDAVAPVADCGEKYYNAHKKCEMKIQEFIEYWKSFIKCDNKDDMPTLYLKDWHFTHDIQDDIYCVPKYFASDWLNEYFAEKRKNDDYRFVYMGPAGSWTPLHVDVFSSFSWSFNVCGRKKWLLFRPGQEDCLKDKFGQLAYDATSPELQDTVKFPHTSKLESSLEVFQEAGEAIFVPSGWHHQVWNVEDTISINHNWVNGCNIQNMWLTLQLNLKAVKREIEDCKTMEEWEEHCQLMLQASCGMNYEEFYTFLNFIGRKRIDMLKKGETITLFGGWCLGKGHAFYDLNALSVTLRSFLSDPDTKVLLFMQKCGDEAKVFLEEIDFVTKSFT